MEVIPNASWKEGKVIDLPPGQYHLSRKERSLTSPQEGKVIDFPPHMGTNGRVVCMLLECILVCLYTHLNTTCDNTRSFFVSTDN